MLVLLFWNEFNFKKHNIIKRRNIKYHMKKQVMILLLALLILPIVYSYQESLGIIKQNEPASLIQTCYDSTEGFITRVVYPDKTFAINEQTAMTKNGDNFNYSFLNTSQLGQYLVYGICDSQVWQYDFEVTVNGEKTTIATSIIHVLFITFFVMLIFVFYYLNNKINFEKWNDSIYNKYLSRNFIKVVFSAILYNFMKNSFVIYYLLGFPIIIILNEIAMSYGLLTVITVLNAFLVIYSIGVILVGVYFFSYVQEWVMDLIEKVKNMGWGIGQ